MFIDPQIEIAIIAFALSCVSQVMQRVLVDRKKMKASQALMKEQRKQITELLKKGDAKSKEQADRIQKEMMQGLSDNMQGSMRLLMFSMVVFLPAFAVLGMFYSGTVANLPFPIPWFGGQDQPFIMFYEQTNWVGWYVLCSLVSSIVLNIVLHFWEKSRGI